LCLSLKQFCPATIRWYFGRRPGRMPGQPRTSSYGEDVWTRGALMALRHALSIRLAMSTSSFKRHRAIRWRLASRRPVVVHSVDLHETGAHRDRRGAVAPAYASNGAKLCWGNGARRQADASKHRALVTKRSDIPFPKPKARGLTQATEWVTV